MPTLVVDASVVVQGCLEADGFRPFDGFGLVSPRLVQSEAMSSLHELTSRGEISAELAKAALQRLRDAPVDVRDPDGLSDAAWDIAEKLGWAKTYDAEYVALARMLECALVTLDVRLARGAGSMATIIGPGDVSTVVSPTAAPDVGA